MVSEMGSGRRRESYDEDDYGLLQGSCDDYANVPSCPRRLGVYDDGGCLEVSS